jgi:hypothetical protein
MLEEFLKTLANATSVDVITLKPGQSIEDAIREHEENCPECRAERERENAMDKDTAQEVEAEADDARDVQRQKALTSTRRAMADLLRRYDLLKELETSLMIPMAERKPVDMLRELVLFAELTRSH